MKQRKALARRTGLKTNTPLRATKPMKRSGASVPGKSSVNPTRAKRPTVTAEERAARSAVHARSGGWCEVQAPGVCLGRATNFQHRVNAGQGGPWTASNGLAVCGQGNATGCHSMIHLNQNTAVDNGWTVKSWDNPLTRPVLYRGQWVLLDNEGGVAPSPNLGKAA